MLNCFFRAWDAKQKACYAGQITKEEYFEWKICWPYSMEDGGTIPDVGGTFLESNFILSKIYFYF